MLWRMGGQLGGLVLLIGAGSDDSRSSGPRWFRVRLSLTGVTADQFKAELPAVAQYLRGCGHLRSPIAEWEPGGRVSFQVEIQEFDARRAADWVHEDLWEIIFAEVMDLDDSELSVMEIVPLEG